jgi:electron transport complex protein RnfC
VPQPGKRTKGVKLRHNKHTMNHATEFMPTPAEVHISLSQHIGAPCEPKVQKGDHVKIGQKIGDSDAFVSAPIHASVSGTVAEIKRSKRGVPETIIVIKSDKEQELWEDIAPPKADSREDFLYAVRESGLVGLGGAAFPTHVKYAPKNLDEVDTFIVNGAECEPFITSDYRTMIEEPNDVIRGIQLVMKHLEIPTAYIGIEDNKPEAIRMLRALTEELPIHVTVLNSLYPKGAERVLIQETTGRVLPQGKLPADIGVIVSNITSVAFLSKYFATGAPLVSKRLTVDGGAVAEPKNILAPIGTKLYEIVNFCGGYKERPQKILMGGPMMGRAVFNDGMSLIKSNNAILALGAEDVVYKEETACINCGRCADSCPINLIPTLIVKAYEKMDIDTLKILKTDMCMECGCCSWRCPAYKELSLINKMAKAVMRGAS